MSELVDYINMPVQRLNDRGKELTWSLNNIRHTPERLEQIKKELGDIAFEMWFRYQDGEFALVDNELQVVKDATT